ncbi:MAG: recombination mediator RecR [Candidatus Comchoanobacterales bacterium]
MNVLNEFIKQLSFLPGIGPKTAQRLAYFMLEPSNRHNAQHLANAIEQAVTRIKPCQQCYDLTDQPLCSICQNPKRDNHLLCVVAYPQDIASIEQTNTFNGRYFVLMGYLSPLDGIGPDDLNINRLKDYVATHPIEEIILAIQSSVEGQATAYFIHQLLKGSNITITQLAHGIPMGGELEYMDTHTIHKAFSARSRLEDVENF